MINSRSKQKGTFSIEFALLGVVFSTMLLFTADTVVKLSVQGKLDRLSYSLVNILKERTQLYGKDDHSLTNAMANELFGFAQGSLSRTLGSYESDRLHGDIEVLSFDQNNRMSTDSRTLNGGCNGSQSITNFQSLSMTTSWGRRAALYRVTLCYDSDNWAFDGDDTTLLSSSLMMGR